MHTYFVHALRRWTDGLLLLGSKVDSGALHTAVIPHHDGYSAGALGDEGQRLTTNSSGTSGELFPPV